MIETGNALKKKREGMSISLDEVSKDLDIPVLLLEQIEAGAVGAFDDIYELKSMMLEYSKYLGENVDLVEKKFNEYMYDYTSRIPIDEIEKVIREKTKEEEDEDRIASPYTVDYKKEKTLPYIICGIIIFILVVIAVLWSLGQITGSATNINGIVN